MRTLSVLFVVCLITGCGQKSEPTKYEPIPVKQFNPKTDPHIIVWEEGRKTNRVRLELVNWQKDWEVVVDERLKAQQGVNIYIFPGKVWGGSGDNTKFGKPKLVFYSKKDDNFLYTDMPEGLTHIFKEKEQVEAK